MRHDACCCKVLKVGKASRKAPTRNLWIIILVQVIAAFNYSIVLPSMHQFITTPKSRPTDAKNATDFWPGLGESEFVYSLAVSASPCGEIVASFCAAFLSQPFPYFFKILFSCFISIAGNILYALAYNGPMVIAARFLSGVSSGFAIVFTLSYIGRSSKNSNGKGCLRKEVKFLLFSISYNASTVAATVLVTILSQFSNINPYHYGGWLVAALTILYAFLFVLIYTENECITQNCMHISNLPCKRILNHKSKQWFHSGQRRCSSKQLFVFSVLISFSAVCATVNPSLYLINPISNDIFGLKLSSISYIWLGVMVVRVSSTFLLAGFEFLKIDSRIGLLIIMLLAMIASALMADWQSYGHNPCSLENVRSVTTPNGSYAEHNPENFSEDSSSLVFSGSGNNLSGLSSSILIATSTNSSIRSIVRQYSNQQLCMSLTTAENQCFWNLESRVTGEKCSNCRAVCLSQQKSLTFIQFIIGMFIFALIIQPTLNFLSVVASNLVKNEDQEVMLGTLYAVLSIFTVASPIWIISVYERSAQHTYYVMSLLTLLSAAALVLFMVAYKWMGPQTFRPRELIRASLYPLAEERPATQHDLSAAIFFRNSVHMWLDATNSFDSFHRNTMEDAHIQEMTEPNQLMPVKFDF